MSAETDTAFALAGPALSVQRRLLDEIGARLASISLENGYAYKMGKLTRASMKPFSGDDMPACNYWPGQDAFIERGVGFEKRELTLLVERYTKTRDDPFSDIVFELALDVDVALRRATAAPSRTGQHEPTLGGRVQSIHLTSITPQIGEGQAPWLGALLSFAISYRVKATDPTVFV